MIFVIIVSAIVYLFLGGFAAGLITDRWDDDGFVAAVVCLWPIFLFSLTIYGIAIGPMKLGRFIKERKNKK